MRPWCILRVIFIVVVGIGSQPVHAQMPANISVARLRCEGLIDPLGIDQVHPRLSWIVESSIRGQKQTAYRILVASSPELLTSDQGDLWDSGKVESDQTTLIPYAGKPLTSRTFCFWKVQAFDRVGQPSAWGTTARWSMGLLKGEDWKAQWISYKDTSPLHKDTKSLYLPPARQYRKGFALAKPIKRAIVYASALGIHDLYLNGQRVSDSVFTPGWSDYHRRSYYNTFDVTSLVQNGENAIGAIVAEGWYSGYVGYGLLCGYGPIKAGRYFYGKTPAFLAQLEIEYADGTRQAIITDPSWKVTDRGPVREADIIMGESYDARLENPDWCKPGFKADGWDNAIHAEANGRTPAIFFDNQGQREVELGFQKPPRMQAYCAPPVRATQELKAVSINKYKPGIYIFDLGQEFAGVVRLKVKGPPGMKVQLRFGEMLHPDGRLMTENLRKARATDYYILRGEAAGETWTPQFTYHGFRYVELTGLPTKPDLDAITGVVIQSDTPLVSSFECSDPMANRLFKNIVWTQRANFVDIPTDCPQRDERLGWMGDAQIYVRAATYNADIDAFFTKWMDDVEESQRSFGAYPDYAPYPMSHGQPDKSWGTAWTDAGIICPWTIWKVYGDTSIIRSHYASMQRFMEFRKAISPKYLGVSIGNDWGDWLNMNEPTPVEYIDCCYFARSSQLMAEMAAAIGKKVDADNYRKHFDNIKAAFNKEYVNSDGSLKVDSQTAYVLALSFGLLPEKLIKPASDILAGKIVKNDFRMATGFLGTKPLLPVLTATGHHDLAVRLFQSRKNPSWGYEVANDATTIWERWDSYSKGGTSAAKHVSMNSFAHYSFGAVCEWMFQSLAGIDTDGPGFKNLILRPGPPTPGSNPDIKPIDWVRAEYDSPTGKIVSQWKREANRFELNLSIPANTAATLYLPAGNASQITESGRPLAEVKDIQILGAQGDRVLMKLGSGEYRFKSAL